MGITLSRKKTVLFLAVAFLLLCLAAIVIRPYSGDNAVLLNYAKCVILFSTFILFSVFYYTFTRTEIKYEFLFSGMVLSFGLVYLFAITPLSGPDEMHHFQSVYTLSNLLMGKDPQLGIAGDFDYHGFVLHQNVPSGYLRIVREFFSPAVGGETIVVPGSRTITYLPEYFLPALFVTLGRLLRLNTMHLCQLGRLANVLLSAVCVYYAIKLTPKFKMLMGIVYTFPMALQQVASMSYDSFVNCMTLLTVALLFRAIFGEGKLTAGQLIALAVVALLQAPAKTVYAFVVFLALFIPKERFARQWIKYVYVPALILACCGFSLFFFLSKPITSRAGDRTYYENGTMYGGAWVLSHIPQSLVILLRSFLREGVAWAGQCIGTSLSGLSLPVSKYLILPFGLLAVVGIFCNCPGEVSVRQKTAERIVSLVIPFVIAVIICTDMLMHYTYNTRPVIDGVQGRYFLPLLPIGFSAFHTEKLRWKPDLNKFVIVALCALQLAVICRIMFYTIRFVV